MCAAAEAWPPAAEEAAPSTAASSISLSQPAPEDTQEVQASLSDVDTSSPEEHSILAKLKDDAEVGTRVVQYNIATFALLLPTSCSTECTTRA